MNIKTSEIIEYLVLLELNINEAYTIDNILNNYKELAKLYHPDTSIKRYKDGNKFIKLNEAKDYLINNIDYVNDLILNDFNYSKLDNDNINIENVKSYSNEILFEANKYKKIEIFSFIIWLFEIVFNVFYISYFINIDSFDFTSKIISYILLIIDITLSLISLILIYKLLLIHKKIFKAYSLKYIFYISSVILFFMSVVFVIALYLSIDEDKYNKNILASFIITYTLMLVFKLIYLLINSRSFINIKENI